MSNIKNKIGICTDCKKEGDETEKVLIAKRCVNFHYPKHRAEVNAEKRESKGDPKKPLSYLQRLSSHTIQNQRKKCKIKPRSKKGQKKANEDSKFFHQIWKDRIHYSQVSGIPLGDEYNPVFFSHILTKGAYPKARHWKENIILMTFEEHNEWEFQQRSKPKFIAKYKDILRLHDELITRYYKE